jgi:hypothetical protein
MPGLHWNSDHHWLNRMGFSQQSPHITIHVVQVFALCAYPGKPPQTTGMHFVMPCQLPNF